VPLERIRACVPVLLARGRRKLAFAGGPMDLQQVADRLQGARASVARISGATLEELSIPQLTVEYGRRAGEQLRERSVGELPDAVFAANDLIAVGLLQAFMLTGWVRVPDEVALVGYDDIAFARAAVVPITSIRQPSELMGQTAIGLVEHVLFPPELIVRASTGAAAPGFERGP